MVISDTSCMINGLPLLYWRRNLGKSGQDSLETELHVRSHTTSHNCAVA